MPHAHATIRVLIADDSFFIRKVLREMLSSEPGFEVVGEAKDGQEAVDQARLLTPDVITMDYQMPVYNGAEATRHILNNSGTVQPAIVMLSAYTKEGAEATFMSLRAGAVDFIAKPSGEVSLDLPELRTEIIAKIRAAARARIIRYKETPQRAVRHAAASGEDWSKLVIFGASTGGPPLLEKIFAELPENLDATFIVVQHLPPQFTTLFAERLNNVSELAVKEAAEGDPLVRGAALVVPGDFHLELKELRKTGKLGIHLNQDPPEHGLRPAIDVTMRSAANLCGSRTIGVVLTGMGRDGAQGIQAIKAADGRALVQDPASSALDAMPRAVIANGAYDEIVQPALLAERIAAFVAL